MKKMYSECCLGNVRTVGDITKYYECHSCNVPCDAMYLTDYEVGMLVERRNKKSEWIKCSDKMPESPEKGSIELLVACFDTQREIYHVSVAEFQRKNFYDRYNERMSVDDPYWPVTHWMPLPDAPENENV